MKNAIRAIAVAALLLPVFASAQANADVVSEAQRLLNQILQLQQQLNGGGGSTASAVGSCTAPSKTLKPGSSGADVTNLQKFLALDAAIYPEGKVTGYYGGLTQAAVGRWQAKMGIVSSGSPSTNGYGAVGPKTLAALQAACGGGAGSSFDPNEPVVGGFINVSPISGEAPLEVSVEATVNTVKSCNGAIYVLSWGDGSAPVNITVPAGNCNVLAQTYKHTYTKGGSFDVKLSSGGHESVSTVEVGGAQGSTGASGTGGSQVVSGNLTINMTTDSFTPSTITVTSGTKITWVNTDTQNHTVSADNGSYQSGTIPPGEKYSLTFTIKGEYNYFCAFHGQAGGVGMAGRIVVQ